MFWANGAIWKALAQPINGATPETYLVVHSLNNDADGIQQSHLGVCKLHLLNQGHDTAQYGRRIREERFWIELPFISNIPELLACSDANDLVVEWIVLV